MADEMVGGVDKGREDASPRRLTLTPKRRAAGLARLSDPTAPEGTIMRRAGYSAATATNPTANLGEGGTFVLARRVIDQETESKLDSVIDLRKVALTTIREILVDKTEVGSTRAAAAAATLRLINESVDYEPPTGSRLHFKLWARRQAWKAQRHGILIATTGRGYLGWTVPKDEAEAEARRNHPARRGRPDYEQRGWRYWEPEAAPMYRPRQFDEDGL